MSKEDLIRELVSASVLQSPRLVSVLRHVDRKNFVPEESAAEAYGNYPLPIGHGQTISQPLTVVFMLELLNVQPGEKILEIGSGSGWQTALLAELVGAQGEVVAIERIPELKEMTEKNLAKYAQLSRRVKVLFGNGSRGAPSDLVPAEGFDKIVAAASGKAVPEAWKEQLKAGGRIVSPVETSILAIDKLSEKEYKTKEYPGFAFVPLVED